MRPALLFFCILLFGCSESQDHEFSYQAAAGKWIIRDVRQEDGSLLDASVINNMSFFGAYNASVQLYEDRTFIPLNKNNDGAYVTEVSESGLYEYLPQTSRLRFQGQSEFEIALKHFSPGLMVVENAGLTGTLVRQ